MHIHRIDLLSILQTGAVSDYFIRGKRILQKGAEGGDGKIIDMSFSIFLHIDFSRR